MKSNQKDCSGRKSSTVEIVGRYVHSYSAKGTDVSDAEWLAGELARDGKHIFAADMTIPILTNGIEWLFMKPDFYAETKVPKIVWQSKNGYGCIKTEDNDICLKSFTIPIVEPGEINFMNNCNKVVEVVNAMRQYIISTLRC